MGELGRKQEGRSLEKLKGPALTPEGAIGSATRGAMQAAHDLGEGGYVGLADVAARRAAEARDAIDNARRAGPGGRVSRAAAFLACYRSATAALATLVALPWLRDVEVDPKRYLH